MSLPWKQILLRPEPACWSLTSLLEHWNSALITWGSHLVFISETEKNHTAGWRFFTKLNACDLKNRFGERKQDWLVQKFGLRRLHRFDSISVEPYFTSSAASIYKVLLAGCLRFKRLIKLHSDVNISSYSSVVPLLNNFNIKTQFSPVLYIGILSNHVLHRI